MKEETCTDNNNERSAKKTFESFSLLYQKNPLGPQYKSLVST